MVRNMKWVALVPLMLAASARAVDTFNYDGLKFQGTVEGLRNGRLWVTLAGGTEREFELPKVEFIALAAAPKFSEAELVRATDAKQAAALYKEALKGINAPAAKQLAELRAIAPADADGKWTDAVVYFLDVYSAQPVDAVWKSRPTHLPEPPSSMLRESADRIATAARVAKADDVRKNLKTLQLEVLTKAGDVEGAGRVAREIATGVADEPTRAVGGAGGSAGAEALAGKVAEVESAVKGKNFAAALKQADALLDALGTGESTAAVQLFALKAQALEGLNQRDLATATLLRIPAHYPGNEKAAPAALLQAAELQKRSDHPAEAAQLYHEIIVNYPESKEAPLAKQAGAK